MTVLLLIAVAFPIALPPIVRAAIVAVINKLTINKFKFKLAASILDKATPADPLIIPQISPITSLQKLDAFSLFWISLTASRAPLTCLVAIELKVFISATVIAIPIISNIIPIPINSKMQMVATMLFALGIVVSETKENTNEMNKARVMTALKQTFRPEFLNRVDETIIFNELTKDELLQIVDLMLNEIATELAEKNIHVSFSDEVKNYL